METEKERKIKQYNKLMQAFCSGSMKGSYQRVADIKHMCEAVIGEYVSATEYVEHWMKYEQGKSIMFMKPLDVEKAIKASEGLSRSDYPAAPWKNIVIYMPVTQKVFSEFYQHCRRGRLTGFLKYTKIGLADEQV